MQKELRILIVEDVHADAELEVRELKRAGLRVTHRLVETEEAFRASLQEFRPELIISDFAMPHFDGMFALALACELAPDVPFIFVSGTIGEEYAIRAVKSGATDYVLKNNLVRLPAAVERALADKKERAARQMADARHRATFDNAPIGIMHTDIDTDRILLVNPKLVELLGYTQDELLGMKTDDILHPDNRGTDRGKYRERMLKGELNSFSSERQFVRKDGSAIWVNRTISLVRDASGKPHYFIRMVEDVTERKSQELKIARLSRIQSVLSGINSAIVRIRDRQELFEEACRIAVEQAGFPLAWIGMLDAASQDLKAAAMAGTVLEYAKLLKPSVREDIPAGQGTNGRAFRERKPIVDNDVSENPNVGFMRGEGLKHGIRAALSLPLLVEGVSVGVLGLYAKEKDYFDEEEMKLLTELAGDISFALEHIAGQERIEKLSRIRAISSEINAAIVRIRDRQKLFEEACRIAVEHGNFGIAWIGMMDQKTKDIVPVACAGVEAESFIATSPNTARLDAPLGLGIVGRALREKRAVYSNDITAERSQGGARRQEAIRRGYRSLISFPLLVEDEAVGSLSLFAKEPNFFDEEEIKLLTELAGDISFALEHFAKEEKLEKLSRIRSVSSEINAAIVRIRDRHALLEETCRIASEHGKFEMIWIGTIDAAKQEIRAVAWTGFSPEIANRVSWKSISAAQGTFSETINTQKATVRNDIETELSVGGMRGEALKRGCRSTVCLPLVVDDEVVVLIALFATGRGFFDESELALLGEVASNISFALESIARQEKIERLSRIRTVLGEMNTAIVRIRSKQQLFEEACRIAQEHGKFAMAWIGVLEEATQAINPVAKSGRDEGYLEELKLTVDPNATRNLAIAVEAMGRAAPVVCNDIATDGRMRPWRAAALQRGYRSMGMLPLLLEQRAVGVFALYSPETGFFDEDEMKLLVELAGDIAFALQTIEKQEKLDYLSYYDPLTGLPNRTLFNDRLEQRISAAQGDQKIFSVIMLDLERFRNINDSLGRQAGDELLLQVGRRLKNALGETDILARIGGDHFAIATRRADAGGNVAHFLEKILTTALGQPFEVGGNELRITARAGVAVYPADGTDAGSLLGNTETALKKAKSSGERYLFYQSKMNAAVAQTLLLENKLRQALEKEQFVLHYQPKVDLAQGTLVGLEALIRWNDPETGLVPPVRFIPLLEETGMILEAGRWAILKSLEVYREWRGRGLQPPRIAVNVSPIQLRQKNFVDVVRAAIGVSAAGSHGLDLEITESLIMEDIVGSIAKLRAVRDMGVNIAIDDFGTGYSSLGYLARLPVNALKIDRSFIITMTKNADSMTIVSTIISLAHALNLKVIAEGVETEEQRNLLQLLKCDEMQGYLFSKPLPAVEIEAKFLGAAASA